MPALTALWLNAAASAKSCIASWIAPRPPAARRYRKVRQIYSVGPAFCGFCPLLGIKPTWRGRSVMAASDPKPTLRHCSPFQCASLDRHDALSRASGMAMRRREFIALPGDAAAGWSLATRAQPCIGLRLNLYSRLSVGSRDPRCGSLVARRGSVTVRSRV
jgi:hypothetical protein